MCVCCSDYSKIEAGSLRLEPTVIQLCEVVERAAHLSWASAASKGLDLAYWLDADLPLFIRVDCVRLQQILLNLMSNG